jgi:hypothetical protein
MALQQAIDSRLSSYRFLLSLFSIPIGGSVSNAITGLSAAVQNQIEGVQV